MWGLGLNSVDLGFTVSGEFNRSLPFRFGRCYSILVYMGAISGLGDRIWG